MTKVQPDLRREPLRYRLKTFFAKPANLILLVFLAALTVLSLLPMITMLAITMLMIIIPAYFSFM